MSRFLATLLESASRSSHGMVSGEPPQQAGYASGAKGLLQGTDGQSFDLKSVSGKLKTKACDYVLKNAKSMV